MLHHWAQIFWEQIGYTTGLIAYVTGIISVYYAVKNNIVTWPWGIVSVILFGYIFWKAHYPSNAALQIVYYLPISIYGWYAWLRFGPNKNDDLPITLLSTRERIGWVAVTILVWLLWGYLEAMYQKNAFLPYIDALTTVLSIVAQYLQTRKRFENWIFWIVANLIYAFWLFPKQNLIGLASLYVLFLVMAVVGAQQWIAIMKGQKAVPEPIIKGYEAEVD